MITILAVCISVAAQLGLIWVAGEVTKGMLPVPEGPNRMMRRFAIWFVSGMFNALLVNLPPVFVNLFLSMALDAIGGWSDPLAWTTTLANVAGWAYPSWLVWVLSDKERDDAR
ncbi:hypothetical protein [Flavimaricola marinus]|uniref:Uncharacterized protein n=1 Tax=Flavimaricola marinus TaxID=1819565 RepID=A0A238L8X2_9RHOB|nr:hypothetical protein [Flavimaricola marinus]SMY06157.1 hypothetical protein LOM8899_00279 [Flavimaricola marinus]